MGNAMMLWGAGVNYLVTVEIQGTHKEKKYKHNYKKRIAAYDEHKLTRRKRGMKN